MSSLANRTLFLLVFILLAYTANSQDISGIWWGNFKKGNLNRDIPALKLEILAVTDSTVIGTLTQSFSGNHFQRYAISGYYKNDIIYINEDSGIVHNVSGFRTLRDYRMKVISVNDKIRLEGISKNHVALPLSHSKLPVWFERDIPVKSEITPFATTISDSQKRPLRIIETIEIKYPPDGVKIEITDNARIDNDIISVIVNGKKLIDNQTLSYTPLTCHAEFSDRNSQIEIVMYAESCGAMPPCTATMKITAADSTYNIGMNSDYKVSGAVRVVLRKR